MVRRMTNLGQFAEERVCFGVWAGLRVGWHYEFTLQGLQGHFCAESSGELNKEDGLVVVERWGVVVEIQ